MAGRDDAPRPLPQGSGAISDSLKAFGATDQIVSQVSEQKLDRHLEKMAEEERITEIGELRTVLPATELGGSFVPEEGSELFARHASFHARDPKTIFDCRNTHTHRTKGGSTVGALSFQPTLECNGQQDGSSCGKQQHSYSDATITHSLSAACALSRMFALASRRKETAHASHVLRRIQTEIVVTRGTEPLMPEELFDMSDRIDVTVEYSGHRMPEYMRTYWLRNASRLATAKVSLM